MRATRTFHREEIVLTFTPFKADAVPHSCGIWIANATHLRGYPLGFGGSQVLE